MEIAWVMGGFFGFVTMVYIAVVIFAPEWVGIQGKAARSIEASHAGDPEPKTKIDSDQV